MNPNDHSFRSRSAFLRKAFASASLAATGIFSASAADLLGSGAKDEERPEN